MLHESSIALKNLLCTPFVCVRSIIVYHTVWHCVDPTVDVYTYVRMYMWILTSVPLMMKSVASESLNSCLNVPKDLVRTIPEGTKTSSGSSAVFSSFPEAERARVAQSKCNTLRSIQYLWGHCKPNRPWSRLYQQRPFTCLVEFSLNSF